MKKFYLFSLLLFTVIILIIIGNADAVFNENEKGVYIGNRQPERQLNIKGNDPFVKASRTLGVRDAVPEGLTKKAWGEIRSSIERDRYRLNMDEHTGKYQAPNHAHEFHASFTSEGLDVSPRQGKKGWSWGLSLTRYGYGSNLHVAPGVEKMITRENRIEYQRGDMVEWYINDHRGLEQGFTLKNRPSGWTGSELLKLQMKISGNLMPEVGKDGKGIVFRNVQGNEILHYNGLYAYDSAGRELTSRMTADKDGIRLIVTDDEAVYPITIDPFIERNKLLASDGEASESFGGSVSISGDMAIVGARYDDDNGDISGSAYIFSRDYGGTDSWGQVQKLTADDGAEYDYFGESVSISGDTAIVGAYNDDDNGANTGSAYIFSRDHGGTDNWGQVQKLTASDNAPDEWFGYSVSISGDTALVGATRDDDNGDYSGSAYIFSRDHGGTDNWGEVQKLTASDGAANEYFGVRVSISGDTAIVGAYADDNGIQSGAAYIFSRDHGGMDNWGEVQKLIASDGGARDFFGASVSISGDAAIVGAYGHDGNGADSGTAYIFSRDHGGTDNWGEVQKLTASDSASMNWFGYGVSISGDKAIVGAYLDDDNGDYSGSAYIFSRDEGGADNWGEVQKLLASDGAANDYFGISVSISGDTTIVGASRDDDNGDDSGSAYIFSASAFGDELAVDFGVHGLWFYENTLWNKMTNWDPNDGLVGWSGGLGVDFGTNGTWNNDGSSWSRISTWDASNGGFAGWSGGLAVDFDGNGLWSFDGSAWDRLTTWDVDNDMTGWSGGLGVDFGTNGLWNWDGGPSWSRITTWDAGGAGLASWGSALVVDFDNNGLWIYEGYVWSRLTNWDPEDDLTGWPGGLAVDFGSNGLWNYDGLSWARLTTWNPGVMSGFDGGLAVDFDANGMWKYDGSSWSKVTNWNPENMADMDLN